MRSNQFETHDSLTFSDLASSRFSSTFMNGLSWNLFIIICDWFEVNFFRGTPNVGNTCIFVKQIPSFTSAWLHALALRLSAHYANIRYKQWQLDIKRNLMSQQSQVAVASIPCIYSLTLPSLFQYCDYVKFVITFVTHCDYVISGQNKQQWLLVYNMCEQPWSSRVMKAQRTSDVKSTLGYVDIPLIFSLMYASEV